MRPQTILILLVLVGAVTAGILLSRGPTDLGAPGSDRVGQKLLPGLADKLNDVATISVTTASGTVSVHRVDAEWRVASKDDYPARFDTVKRLLVTAGDLAVLEAKTSKAELLGKLGLEEPTAAGATSVLLTLQGADGAPLASLVVGKAGPGSGTTYVRRAGENDSWLVRGALNVERAASDWMDHELPKLSSDRVKAVSITHADGGTANVAREKKDDPIWALADVPDGMQPSSSTVGRTLAGALENLTFDDVRAAAATPLAGEQQAVAVFTTFDGLRVTATSAVEDGKSWVSFAASADAGAEDAVTKEVADLTSRLSPWLFQIADYRASNLRKHTSDLVQPKKEPEPAAVPAPAAPEGTAPGDGATPDTAPPPAVPTSPAGEQPPTPADAPH